MLGGDLIGELLFNLAEVADGDLLIGRNCGCVLSIGQVFTSAHWDLLEPQMDDEGVVELVRVGELVVDEVIHLAIVELEVYSQGVFELAVGWTGSIKVEGLGLEALNQVFRARPAQRCALFLA